MRSRVLGGLLVVLIAWLPGAVSHADEGIAWTVATSDNGTSRPNFVYEANPGETVEDTWVVANAGSEAVTLQVYATDAFTTSSGQLDLQTVDTEPTGLGAWVQTDSTTLTLAPGESADVDFTVKVPADALPGDYAGGLVTSVTDTSEANVQIERRLATRIHLRVPGELTASFALTAVQAHASAAINPFAPVTVDLDYDATNDGTARAFGRETITVSGPGGMGRTVVVRALAETLPGSTLDQSFTVAGVWAFGPTSDTVEVIPEGIDGAPGTPVTSQTQLWLVPWGWIAVVVVLVAAAVTIGVIRGRRRWEWVDADAGPEGHTQAPEAADAQVTEITPTELDASAADPAGSDERASDPGDPRSARD